MNSTVNEGDRQSSDKMNLFFADMLHNQSSQRDSIAESPD